MPGEARKLIAAHPVTMPKAIPHLFAALAVFAAAGAASAQSAATAPCATTPDSARAGTAPRNADVVIRASVTIDELRFQTLPQARAIDPGCPGHSPVRVVERSNLPERIEPGVTYRNVHVAVEIVGRLEAACLASLAGDAALAQALGGSGCAPAAADTARAPPRP
jgi:hypothetical protein